MYYSVDFLIAWQYRKLNRNYNASTSTVESMRLFFLFFKQMVFVITIDVNTEFRYNFRNEKEGRLKNVLTTGVNVKITILKSEFELPHLRLKLCILQKICPLFLTYIWNYLRKPSCTIQVNTLAKSVSYRIAHLKCLSIFKWPFYSVSVIIKFAALGWISILLGSNNFQIWVFVSEKYNWNQREPEINLTRTKNIS